MFKFIQFLFISSLALSSTGFASTPATAILHKEPWCGCCTQYGHYLEQNKISVELVDHQNITPVKYFFGTQHAPSCHTVELDNYIIEGHVPVAAIHKLLQERPNIKGIAVPDMPLNSPGMGPEVHGTLPVLMLDHSGKIIGEFGRF